MKTKCRIGIDFHGVINARPLFFKELIDVALQKGIEIYIISGGPKDTISDYLKKYDVQYTELWCIYDHYKHNHRIDFLPDGSFHVDDELWNRAKAEYCRRKNICLHIDDSVIYGRDFSTPYCLYNEKENSCRVAQNTLVFKTPKETLEKLLFYCVKH